MAARLEKAVVIPGDPTLEGIFLPAEQAPETAGEAPAPGALVAPPHPLFGGSMDNPVVGEVAYACAARRLASLRFNWRGTGASAGEPSGEREHADADLGSALTHLAETLPGPLAACGYSFGAAAALRAAGHPRVERLVLVALPPSLADREALARHAGPVLAIAGERDELAPWRALQEVLADHPDARLEIVPDADHFFTAGLGTLRRLLLDWL